jgi:hypothetical protein
MTAEPNQAQIIDQKVADSLRTKLKHYLGELDSSHSELAKGLKISRPTIIKFLNEPTAKLPPLTPGQIINLWEKLTENISPHKPKSNARQREYALQKRRRLLEEGPGELLSAAGFHPLSGDWIKVSSYHYPQMLQLALLLCGNQLGLDFETYITVTQQFIDILIGRIKESLGNLEDDNGGTEANLDPIKQYFLRHPILDPTSQDELLKKYDKACNTFPKKLSISERIGLASTIALNEVTKDKQLAWSLRVIGYEFKQLTILIPEQDQWKSIYQSVMQQGTGAEREFLSSDNKTALNNDLPTTSPVIQAKVICRSGVQGDAESSVIHFYFISNNTPLSAAFNATLLHLGFRYCSSVYKVQNESLDSNINSLVKSTVALEYKENHYYYQGDWVDKDLIKTAMQSLIVASKKILGSLFNQQQSETYKQIVLKLSSLRARLDQAYKAFQDYNLSEAKTTDQFFTDLSQDSYSCFNEICEANSLGLLQKGFAIEVYRIYLLSQIYRIRISHIFGNLTGAQKQLEETETIIKDIENNQFDGTSEYKALIPIHILWKTEQKLLQLSIGTGDFWSKDIQNLKDWKEEIKIEIKKHLNLINSSDNEQNTSQTNDLPYDPGLITYQSLGETHFLIGQWLFYTQLSNETLKEAHDNFLQAAYFYFRIGLARRAAQSLALATRSLIRLKDSEKVKESIDLVKSLVQSNFSASHNSSYHQGLMSEVYLLNGEYYAVINQDYERGIIECLKGLKGALWMGFSRRVTENLYTIWYSAQYLGNRRVIEDLQHSETFAILWEVMGNKDLDEDLLDKLSKILLSESCRKNGILKDVIRFICKIKQLSQDKERTLYWNHIAEEFKQEAARIWHEWSRQVHPTNELHKHPIGQQIEEKTFLNRVS